jgi:hypothetical protein
MIREDGVLVALAERFANAVEAGRFDHAQDWAEAAFRRCADLAPVSDDD